MGKIYELTERQQQLDSLLYWEEEGSERAELMLKEMQMLHGDAENLVKFLATLYDEKRSMVEAMQEAKRRAVATFDRRIKKQENKALWYKENIASLMKQFDIKKVEGEYCDITLLKDAKSVGIGDAFSIDSLPDDCIKTEIKKTLDKAAAMARLEQGENLTGLYIATKSSIRVV